MTPHRLSAFLLVLLAFLGACAPAPASSTAPSASAEATTPATASAPAAAYPLTLTDDAGREVTIEAEPARIVSLAPSNTEIVCALDACDRLVGVTDFDDYPAEVIEIDKVVNVTRSTSRRSSPPSRTSCWPPATS